MIRQISIPTPGKGLLDVTREVAQAVADSRLTEGLCTILIQHTSARLSIQENADPSARLDLENWRDRHVPEDDPNFTHTLEGPDDMPSHIRSALTSTTLSIPIVAGRLALGTWQGIYLWEHRRRGSTRQLVLHLGE